MAIELPKDAEGREIPLDTVALFGGNGNAYSIKRWVYTTDFDLGDSTAGQWRALTDKMTRLDPELMYLNPPDSWEKLDEDLSRIARSALERKAWPCAYFNRTPMKCYGCRADKRFGHCEGYVIDNIKSRILKLRGEDE